MGVSRLQAGSGAGVFAATTDFRRHMVLPAGWDLGGSRRLGGIVL